MAKKVEWKKLIFRPRRTFLALKAVSNARAAARQYDWESARQHYVKALAHDKKLPHIWVQYGHTLLQTEKMREATEAYKQAIELEPSADGFLQLGRSYKYQGAYNEAVDALQKAHALDSKNQEINQELAHVDRSASLIRRHNNEIRYLIAKELNLSTSESVILVTHVPSGRIKPHVLPYMKLLKEAGLSLLLVPVVDRPLELSEEELATADGIVVRDNGGYDFAAWTDALKIYPELFGSRLLIVTNDSVVPTADNKVFNTMLDLVRQSPADVIGLTESHEYGWHIQTYFLGLKPKALSSWVFHHFVRDIKRIDDKDEVIHACEIPFANKMQAGGLSIDVIYKSNYPANPTFFDWRGLIESGFPFIKLLMLRDSFKKSTDQLEVLNDLHKSWPIFLDKAGFDVSLVRAAIRAADLSTLPSGSDKSLVVNPRPFQVITDDHSLRVAYFGPWNYDNGLGTASRELLCALRRTNIQLNTYPVVKPFHIHQLICPPVETIDFTGQPDIAIVHLNPDSWNVLTDEQRRIIRSAKQRIGSWVWETDRLPEVWRQELHSVERIWAPSSYCAEVFAQEVDVPVDVVPHPVRIPARAPTGRDALLMRLGINPQKHMILYIFDGASYLIRKNPHGLIRAFAASGLAQQGWVLVLKTKHLYDQQEAGKELEVLAAQTEGVKLLDISLYPDEVISLLAAADIYASPHCSEGFGLTVAEAMAVGTPVVATDYSGTKDFLDAKCGYPVPATLWTLKENHGHYLAGHRWAKVDEQALTAMLLKAATAVINGDKTIGEAAQANIARLLSYDAVAKAITVSLESVVANTVNAKKIQSGRKKLMHVPLPPPVRVTLSSGQKFSQFVAERGVVPVPLNPDLSWNGKPIPSGKSDDWIFLAPEDAYIAPEIVHYIHSSSTDRPDAVMFYADDVAAKEDMLDRLRLKPDFNRTLLSAQDYIGAPVFVRRHVLSEVGGLDQDRGTATLYDLVLRVAQAGRVITRIPHVLVGYKGQRPMPDKKARREALVRLQNNENIEFVDGLAPGLLTQRRHFVDKDCPALSIVIPTRRTCMAKSTKTYLENLLERIAIAEWPMSKVTVIVGDDVQGEPDWAMRTWPFTLKRIETLRKSGEPFNYSAKMNQLWRTSRDEYIIFINDDVQPTNPKWLKALMTFACDDSVGGVGARLYYEDGSIQHVGMFPTYRTVAHAWLNWPADAKTYQDWALTQREWSMVTGAVFAIRRAVLDQVNGFEERFALEFNDVDLCLRIRNLGYRIVYNSDAQFIHAEKATRGDEVPSGTEVALFLSRWGNWLPWDPASHPDYAKNRLDIVALPKGNKWYL